MKKKGQKMTDRQKRFCDEYLIDCNAVQAAVRSGYSRGYADQVLKSPRVKRYLKEQMEAIHSERIADVREITEYLTSVMRGSCDEQTKTSVSESGETTTYITVSTKERLKAAELLGKRYGMFKEKTEAAFNTPVIICGEEEIAN
ncbi:MAG: terminase small subunit [Bacteroides sp.]|nr:terminase small subunit [Bacteroides sp.]